MQQKGADRKPHDVRRALWNQELRAKGSAAHRFRTHNLSEPIATRGLSLDVRREAGQETKKLLVRPSSFAFSPSVSFCFPVGATVARASRFMFPPQI
jgi:hypothetical protein